MRSLPMLPFELAVTEVAPSLNMPELKASMCPPLKILTCSASGVNLLGSALAEFIVAGPVRAKHGLGGSGFLILR